MAPLERMRGMHVGRRPGVLCAHADGAPAAEADAAAACGGGAFDARFASGDGGWAGAPRFG
mgnify:CR=1 FL=1